MLFSMHSCAQKITPPRGFFKMPFVESLEECRESECDPHFSRLLSSSRQAEFSRRFFLLHLVAATHHHLNVTSLRWCITPHIGLSFFTWFLLIFSYLSIPSWQSSQPTSRATDSFSVILSSFFVALSRPLTFVI